MLPTWLPALLAPLLQQPPCNDSVDFFEENDTCATAVPIQTGAVDLRVHISDPDWYSMRVGPQGTLVVDVLFAHVHANVDVRLWDACGGSVLVHANSVTDDEHVIWFNFTDEPVTYLCEVFVNPASDGRCNVYDMDVFGVSDNVGANYCQVNANSTGQIANLRAEGSLSVAQNEIELVVSTIPARQAGLFYYGPQQLEIAFGNGWRCVGPGALGTFLLRAARADDAGLMRCPLDLDHPPRPEGQILAGSTWYFQAWFRDPWAEGSRFNLSDGLEVVFQP